MSPAVSPSPSRRLVPMPKIALSDAVLAKLKPPGEGRADYTDAKVPGLTLRLTPTGAATWCLRYRPRAASRSA